MSLEFDFAICNCEEPAGRRGNLVNGLLRYARNDEMAVRNDEMAVRNDEMTAQLAMSRIIRGVAGCPR